MSAKSSTARFRDIQEQFASGREAYIWLVEKFISSKPATFKGDPSSNALKAILGNSQKYFANNVETLFHDAPHCIAQKSMFARLTNGWVASVILSNAQKFDILLRFAAVAQLSYPQDWDWTVQGASALLVNKQAALEMAEK